MVKKAETWWQNIQGKLAETLRELPPIIGNEAVNFVSENFDRQAWNGVPWQPRRNPTKWGKRDDTGRSLLVKTGKLRRSIRISEITQHKVTITAGGADVPYARAHNEGLSGLMEQNVNPFLRRGKKGEAIPVKGFKRTINQNLPRRQFIGDEKSSPELARRIQETVKKEISKKFKIK